MRPRRLVALLAATTLLPVTAALAGGLGAVQALPTTSLTGIVDVPDTADTFRAELGPGRNTLAVSWSVPAGSQGRREVWLQVRRGGAWESPVLVSDPAVDSWDPEIAVDTAGTVEVAWLEDLTPDRLVVRAAGPDGLGARRVIAAAPSEGFRLANGPSKTVVAWDRYDGGGRLRVHAATDRGAGFDAPTMVSSASATDDTYVADVAADAGTHVLMSRRVTPGGGGATTWPTVWAHENADGSWARRELSNSLASVSGASDRTTHVAVDQATGDAAFFYHGRVGGVTRRFVTGWDADPLVVGPAEDRLTAPVDLGPGNGLGNRDALSPSAGLVGVLGDGLAPVAVSLGVATSTVGTPVSAACADGGFSLLEDLSYVCLTRSDPAGAWVDVSLDATGAVLGRISPGPDATKVSVSPVNVSTPVFLVRETRTGLPAAQSLLVVGSAAPQQPTTPSSPSPTAPAPVPTQPTSTLPPPGGAASFVQSSAPRITGRLRVGRTLKAAPGTWTPAPSTVRYQWLANGKKIRRATKPQLRLTTALRGKKVAVRITLGRPGTTTKVVTVKKAGKVR